MKLCGALALAAMALLIVGCAARKAAEVGGGEPEPAAPEITEEQSAAPVVEPPEPPAPGGSDDYIDPDAPTTIVSDELTSFSAYIALDYEIEGHPELRDWHFVRLEAARDGEGVRCRLENALEQRESTRDAAFLDALGELIARHNLAAENGRFHHTYGLPDDFGVTLDAVYASGETIRFSDNQSMFLPVDAVTELITLFNK